MTNMRNTSSFQSYLLSHIESGTASGSEVVLVNLICVSPMPPQTLVPLYKEWQNGTAELLVSDFIKLHILLTVFAVVFTWTSLFRVRLKISPLFQRSVTSHSCSTWSRKLELYFSFVLVPLMELPMKHSSILCHRSWWQWIWQWVRQVVEGKWVAPWWTVLTRLWTVSIGHPVAGPW